MDFMDTEEAVDDIGKVMSIFYHNCRDINAFLTIADYFKVKREVDYVYAVCDKAFTLLKDMDKYRNFKHERTSYFTSKEQEQNVLGKFKQDSNILYMITLEKELFNKLPGYIILTEDARQNMELKIATLMINTAIDRKKSLMAGKYETETIDDFVLDSTIEEVLNKCCDFVVVPQHINSLCSMVDAASSVPDITIPIFLKSFMLLKDIKKKFLENCKIRAKGLLLERDEKLHKDRKQNFSPDKQKELNDLKLFMSKYVQPYCGGIDVNNITQIENLFLETAKSMISCSLNVKINVIKKQEDYTLGKHRNLLTKKRKKI